MISSVCLRLKISENLFEGSNIPLTIKDALNFLKNSENQNIPNHIKKLFQFLQHDQEYTDEYIIDKVDYLWLIAEIENEIKQMDETKSVFDLIYNSIILCLENYNIYKKLGMFKNTMQNKINEIIRNKDTVNKKHRFLYEKSLELQKLHIYDALVDPSMIRDEFKIPIG
jgi:hypothetical protein